MAGVLLTMTALAGGELSDATDLGFLLHKNPGRAQCFDLAVGRAHVFYPDADADRCTAALLLEVDPIDLVRGRRLTGGAFALRQYVNDRPYAASSLLSVALGTVFKTAKAGRCEARPELVETPIRLEIRIPALPARGGTDLVARLFEPLGWAVEADPVPLDETVPGWGASRYVDLRLAGTVRLADALSQLYVLLPVLDDAKHYWVASDEVDKLIRAGSGWLGTHPEREQIARRYLAHQRQYVVDATERLMELDDSPVFALEKDLEVSGEKAEGYSPDSAGTEAGPVAGEGSPESGRNAPEVAPLNRLRAEAVVAALEEHGVSTVVDAGCGEGALLLRLARDRRFTRLLGADVSAQALERAAQRLRLTEASDAERERIALVQSSVTYADGRLAGYDAVVLMEVLEHIDPPRHAALERAVFGRARPRVVVVTTPNAEYNVRYGLAGVRHSDHRFEWTREQFEGWAGGVAARAGYDVGFRGVGGTASAAGPSTPDAGRPVPGADARDPDAGAPTQMAVFVRQESEGSRR